MVNNSVFCFHGGLSPTIDKLDQIKNLNCHSEVPVDEPMCDLLWSNLHEQDGSETSIKGQVSFSDHVF